MIFDLATYEMNNNPNKLLRGTSNLSLVHKHVVNIVIHETATRVHDQQLTTKPERSPTSTHTIHQPRRGEKQEWKKGDKHREWRARGLNKYKASENEVRQQESVKVIVLSGVEEKKHRNRRREPMTDNLKR